jgi:hypothetical protein
MSFFKLSKPAWKLTDEEYVERVRATLKRIKPWHKAASVFWLLIVAAMFLLTVMAVGVALDHPAGPEPSSMALAYLLGGTAGWMMGFTILKAVFLMSEVWTMERTYRIMLESWDRTKQLERSGEPSGNSKVNAPQP